MIEHQRPLSLTTGGQQATCSNNTAGSQLRYVINPDPTSNVKPQTLNIFNNNFSPGVNVLVRENNAKTGRHDLGDQNDVGKPGETVQITLPFYYQYRKYLYIGKYFFLMKDCGKLLILVSYIFGLVSHFLNLVCCIFVLRSHFRFFFSILFARLSASAVFCLSCSVLLLISAVIFTILKALFCQICQISAIFC